ncbi:hypothetical protein JHK85_004531 [Glycine max]|nr:hypothetical protein JHK85_004531 [Glycine max]
MKKRDTGHQSVSLENKIGDSTVLKIGDSAKVVIKQDMKGRKHKYGFNNNKREKPEKVRVLDDETGDKHELVCLCVCVFVCDEGVSVCVFVSLCVMRGLEDLRHSLLYTTLLLDATIASAKEDITRRECELIHLVLCECCFAWILWKLGRIDGNPVLRETRIWATWEYVSSVGGGQQGMVGLCAHCGCGKTCCAPSPDRHLVPHVMEWYLEICRGGQETLGTSGGVLLPKTKLDQSRPNPGIIVMAAQLIRDRVEMECLEGAWETLEGNTRCRFRGTIRFTATSLVHPDEPARTLQRTVEWILPTPTPYRLVEPVQVIEVTSSEEDPEEDLEELPPEPAVDALDFLEGDEDPLLEVDSPEEVMSASEADSTEDSGPREMAISGGSSS